MEESGERGKKGREKARKRGVGDNLQRRRWHKEKMKGKYRRKLGIMLAEREKVGQERTRRTTGSTYLVFVVIIASSNP